jgi:hypothetical protein
MPCAHAVLTMQEKMTAVAPILFAMAILLPARRVATRQHLGLFWCLGRFGAALTAAIIEL